MSYQIYENKVVIGKLPMNENEMKHRQLHLPFVKVYNIMCHRWVYFTTMLSQLSPLISLLFVRFRSVSQSCGCLSGEEIRGRDNSTTQVNRYRRQVKGL